MWFQLQSRLSIFVRWMGIQRSASLFFFNDTPTTEIYTLSLHDALPIWRFFIAQTEDAMTDLDFDTFLKTDIRVGRVTRAEPYPEARNPSIILWVDFGSEIGEKKTSAQITVHYAPEELVGRMVVGVINFPPRQIGNFMSEFLVLGVPDANGDIVLLSPDQDVPVGGRMH